MVTYYSSQPTLTNTHSNLICLILKLQPVFSSYFSLIQIPKHGVETYCPHLNIYLCGSLFSPLFSIISVFCQCYSESSMISQPHTLLTQMTHTCNTSRGTPPPPQWTGRLLLSIKIQLIRHHLWEADQLADVPSSMIPYHSVLISIIVIIILYVSVFV